MLASLELFGFKSFAERTTFEFAPGVTAVVGPNGSGKSNVVDAIKWVLGDQSAKSLRGKEMTDVIFNGATGRKPSNVSEATLTFDNRSGFLPTPDARVRVGRRLWRNGDSEYLLNDQVVRLKDVRDLFLGTGAGASAYAIIEQGRVDQILQANAIGRRAVFEEAAGISRYKARKTDALRRLERVDQNLLRLTDIVDEVEARLNATRSQAVKASKHRELSKELESWWLGLACDDYRHAGSQLESFRAAQSESQAELDALNAEREQLDRRLGGLDAELGRADETLRSAERQASTAREAISGHEAAARYQAARLEELDAELVRLRRQLTLLSSRAAEAAREQEHNAAVLATSERDLEVQRQRLATRVAGLKEHAQRLEADREQIASDRAAQLRCMRQIADAENQIAARSAETAALGAALDGVMARLETVGHEHAAAEAALATQIELAEEADAAVRLRRGRVADLLAARESLANSRERLSADLAVLREHRSATSARIAVLEDLLARGEGVGIGVREILKRARTLGDAPWNRIYGTVADLLDVDLDDAPLLEVALGDRAQLVVIEDFETLIPYLGRASAKISGRVGFLSNRESPGSLDSEFAGVRYIEAHPKGGRAETQSGGAEISGSDEATPRSFVDARSPSLDGLPGVIKRADELIRPTSRMPHLATRLLADTWVVESLPVALRLAAGAGRGLRFVTLAGELFDSDGTLVVGTLRADAAVISRRSELLRLRDELIDVDRAIEAGTHRQETLATSQDSLTESLSQGEADLRAAVDAYNRATAELTECERRCRRLSDEQTLLTEDVAARRARVAEIADAIQSAERERDAARADLDSLETGLAIAERSVAECEQQIAAGERELSIGRLDLAKTEERLNGLQEAVDRMEREAAQRAAQHSEAVRRFEAAIVKRSEVTRHLLNTQSAFAEAMLDRERHAAAVERAAAARDRLKRQRGEFSAAETQLRNRSRIASESHHAAEMSARELEHRLSTLAERIREEYGHELAELAAGERSAVMLWIEEQDTGSGGQDDDATVPRSPLPAVELPPFAELRPELEARVDRLRKRLKMLGTVNADSLADLDELEQRHARLAGQLQDLVEAKRTLEDVIRRINAESKRLFAETFETIRGHFQDLFRKLFGGGEGDIVLDDSNDILECGIDVVARPPGKELRSLSLLSGGEKTMTCVGLLLAIFKSKPSPFCLLDEVDAALDEANIGRFVGVLKEFKSTTQFIMITHRKPSMCEADVLYGVTMEQAGVSKRLNVRFDDVADDGSFRTVKRAA